MADAEQMWESAIAEAERRIKVKQFEEKHKDILQDIKENPTAFLIAYFKLKGEYNELLQELEGKNP